jgi:HlyD family secretion protein
MDELRSGSVERGTLRVAITASGALEATAQVDLGFDLPGRVAEAAVDIGDQVRQDQMLTRLETTDLERAVEQAELNLRQTELRLERIEQPADEADLQRAENAVNQAAAALEVAQINQDGVLNSVLLNETLEDAQSAFDDAKERYETNLREYEEGEIAYWYVDQAEQRYEDAQLALERVQQQVDLQSESSQNEVTRAWQTYQEAQDALEQLLDGADQLDLEAARLDVEAAQLALERAESDLEKATLVAPFDSFVAAVNVTVGEMAPTALPAVSLVDPSQFRITVSVDEIDIAGLAVGLPVDITVDAFPGLVVTGIVERIGPAAMLSGGAVTYPVVIALDPTEEPLRAGMTATTVILVEELEDELLVPNWLVRVDQTTGQTYVHRQLDEGYERVDVQLGIRYEGYSQVLGGLHNGDVLVLVQQNGGFFSGQ